MQQNRTGGRGHKDFKKGGVKPGQGVGALKRVGGVGTPLGTIIIGDVPHRIMCITV